MKLIIINLLAEEEQAEQARARDPVKILAALSMGLLAMVVAIGGVLAGVALRSGVALNEVERQLQTLEKQQTRGTIGAYRSLKQWTDDLLEINQSRQLYAPQLALIKNLVPDFIQLTRLSLATRRQSDQRPAGRGRGQFPPRLGNRRHAQCANPAGATAFFWADDGPVGTERFCRWPICD